jgi:hypothetical protein
MDWTSPGPPETTWSPEQSLPFKHGQRRGHQLRSFLLRYGISFEALESAGLVPSRANARTLLPF